MKERYEKRFVCIDVLITNNPKILLAGEKFADAVGWLHVAGITYSKLHNTDGFIPESIAKTLTFSAKKVLKILVETCKLWTKTEGGFVIHDYEEWQETSSDIEQKKQQKVEAGKRGGYQKAINRGNEHHVNSPSTRLAPASVSLEQNTDTDLAPASVLPERSGVSANEKQLAESWQNLAEREREYIYPHTPSGGYAGDSLVMEIDAPPPVRIGNSAERPPKHRPAEAAEFYASYAKPGSVKAFIAAWDAMKPDTAQIERARQHNAALAARSLSIDEKRKVPRPEVYVRQGRFDWEDPFPGLGLYDEDRRRLAVMNGGVVITPPPSGVTFELRKYDIGPDIEF